MDYQFRNQKNSFSSLKQDEYSPERTTKSTNIRQIRSHILESEDYSKPIFQANTLSSKIDHLDEHRQSKNNNKDKTFNMRNSSNKNQFYNNSGNRISGNFSHNELNFSFGEESHSKRLHESPQQETKNFLNETFGEHQQLYKSEMSFENFSQDSSQFFNQNSEQYMSFSNLQTFNQKSNQDSSIHTFEARKNQIDDLAQYIFQNYQLDIWMPKKQKHSMEIESRTSNEFKEQKSFLKYSERFKFGVNICYDKRDNNILKQIYQVEDMICESTFSYIYTGYCQTSNKYVCIKKMKNQKEIFDQGIFEIYILSYLRKKGDPLKYKFLKISDFFYMNKHLYIITEQLGESLYQKFIQNKVKLSLRQLQAILKNIVYSMRFMKEVGIIHCDLKPENILLLKEDDHQAKIIDFGNAIFIDDNNVHVEMQTVPYRAPEVTLKANFDYQIDMWSLGCITYELITSKVLFSSQKPIENLVLACSINSSINLSVFKNIRNQNLSYNNFPISKRDQQKDTLDIVVPAQKFSIQAAIKKVYNDSQLVDFVKQCLILDPQKRLSIEQAMSHPFFKKKYQQYIYKFNFNKLQKK